MKTTERRRGDGGRGEETLRISLGLFFFSHSFFVFHDEVVALSSVCDREAQTVEADNRGVFVGAKERT